MKLSILQMYLWLTHRDERIDWMFGGEQGWHFPSVLIMELNPVAYWCWI